MNFKEGDIVFIPFLNTTGMVVAFLGDLSRDTSFHYLVSLDSRNGKNIPIKKNELILPTDLQKALR